MQIDTNYDIDYYKWANDQAKLLRSGNLQAADIDHIAEEISLENGQRPLSTTVQTL